MNKIINNKYRPDIDGLRAIAVISVLIFHAFPSALPGGFIGVDIFFVISGYLISKIIMESLERGDFSFSSFYARRIKRIYPALLLVMSASLAFGWVALFPGEYRQLGKHVAAGAAFVSNLILWSESGYFDKAAIAKPLLHLWSLGVEEQFYIFWPLFLWLAWKMRFNLLLTAVGLAVLSFGANIIAMGNNPVAAFYSPFNRFWELMIGAILAYGAIHFKFRAGSSTKKNNIVSKSNAVAAEAFSLPSYWYSIFSFLGIGLILLGIFSIREANFPGWQALIPTTGAMFLIAAGPNALLNRVVLSSRPMVWIGLISYPLYLWHWPLFSFVRIMQGNPSSQMRLSLLVASVVLASLTYLLLEKPLKAVSRRRATTVVLSVLMVILGAMGLLVHAKHGVESRAMVHANAKIENGEDGGFPIYAGPCDFLSPEEQQLFYCAIDKREKPHFALIGDSKAGALFLGLFRTSQEEGTWLVMTSGGGGTFVPVLSDKLLYATQNKLPIENAIKVINRTDSINTVVIATSARALFRLKNDYSIEDLPASKNYDDALEGLDSVVSKLLSANKQVVLVVDNPTLPHMEDCLYRQTSSPLVNFIVPPTANTACQLPVSRHLELSKKYRHMLSAIESRHAGKVKIFDPTATLCNMTAGVCQPTKNGRYLYHVTDHISGYGATLVGQELNRFLHAERPVARTKKVVLNNWAPRETSKGQGTNVQPDGKSIMWIAADNISRFGQTFVVFGKEGAKNVAYVDEKLVTVEIPKEVINKSGNYTVAIEEQNGRRTEIGTFVVKP